MRAGCSPRARHTARARRPQARYGSACPSRLLSSPLLARPPAPASPPARPPAMGATRFAAAAALAAVLARCAPAAAQMTVMGAADHIVFDHFEGEDCSGRVTTHVWPKATECQGPYIAAGPDDDSTDIYCYEGDSECDGVDVDGQMAPDTIFYTRFLADCEEKIARRYAFTDAKCKKPMGGKKNQIFIDYAHLDKSCGPSYEPDQQAMRHVKSAALERRRCASFSSTSRACYLRSHALCRGDTPRPFRALAQSCVCYADRTSRAAYLGAN